MKVLVPVAQGYEEIETNTIIDVLRRAGMDVVTAGVPSTMLNGMHNVKMMADRRLDEVKNEDFDAIVLPGGAPAYDNLSRSQTVLDLIRKFDSEKKIVAAICGSPVVLAKAGIIDKRRATIYPGMEKELMMPRDGPVVKDDHIITSQGPGTSIEFSLAIVSELLGKEISERVRKELVHV